VVAVTVRGGARDGAAAPAAETQRLRVPAHGSATRRIVFAETPVQVQVNDGSVPEMLTSVHTLAVTLPVR
jgi:hypothetical protein